MWQSTAPEIDSTEATYKLQKMIANILETNKDLTDMFSGRKHVEINIVNCLLPTLRFKAVTYDLSVLITCCCLISSTTIVP